MKKYEYKTFQRELYDSELNKLGDEGWQLISHTAVVNESSFGQYYVFMREKVEN